MDRGIYQKSKSFGVQKNYFIEFEDLEYITIKIAIPGENDVHSIKIVMDKGVLKVNYPGNTFTEEFYYYYKTEVSVSKKDTYAELEDGVLTIKIKKNLDNRK